MTEIPALRDALVDAAARRARRRMPRLRASRLLTAAGAVAVLAALAAVVVLLARPAPERARPGASPTAARDVLAADFAVFRRPRTRADAFPSPFGADLEWGRSRLVASLGSLRLWLVPERDGELCALLRGARATSPTCAHVSTGGVIIEGLDPGSPAIVFGAVPDAVRDVRATRATGVSRAVPVRDNAFLVELRGRVASVGWTAGETRYVHRWRVLAPGVVAEPQGCPRLGPLPPHALEQARRAALLSVDVQRPGVERATVTNATRASGTPCGLRVTHRSIAVGLHLTTSDRAARTSASLSQGRLLLGMVGGRMTVYAVMH